MAGWEETPLPGGLRSRRRTGGPPGHPRQRRQPALGDGDARRHGHEGRARHAGGPGGQGLRGEHRGRPHRRGHRPAQARRLSAQGIGTPASRPRRGTDHDACPCTSQPASRRFAAMKPDVAARSIRAVGMGSRNEPGAKGGQSGARGTRRSARRRRTACAAHGAGSAVSPGTRARCVSRSAPTCAPGRRAAARATGRRTPSAPKARRWGSPPALRLPPPRAGAGQSRQPRAGRRRQPLRAEASEGQRGQLEGKAMAPYPFAPGVAPDRRRWSSFR